MKKIIFLALVLVGSSSQATTLKTCEESAIELADVVLPPAETSRAFCKDSVGVYTVAHEDPQFSGVGIAITLFDDTTDHGFMKCLGTLGFKSVDVKHAKSKCDNTGLQLTFPIETQNPLTRKITKGQYKILINFKTATATEL